MNSDVTRLLDAIELDDPKAAEEQLPLVYQEPCGGASKHRRIHDGEHILEQVLRSALDELHIPRAIIE